MISSVRTGKVVSISRDMFYWGLTASLSYTRVVNFRKKQKGKLMSFAVYVCMFN